MSRTFKLATLIVAASLSSIRPASAQNGQPLKYTGPATQAAITADDAKTRLYIFADDSMMGRRAGDIGGMKGTAYIEREVRRMGLIPAGDNGTFFQAVPLYDRSLDMSSKLSADAEALTLNTDYIPLSFGGKARALEGAQIIYAGSPADQASMISPEAAAGKVVAVTGSTSGIARRYPGAIGFIVFRPDAALAQTRRFAMNPSTLMHSEEDTATTTMTLVIPNSASAKVLGVPAENARPGTVGRTLHGEIKYTMKDVPARNVVGIIRGSDPKLRNEYVAIGAHNDHLGLRRAGPLDTDSVRAFNQAAERIFVARTHELPGFPGSGLTAEERATIKINLDSLHAIRPARLDSVYNGADDDGSGSVGALEVAEKFAAAKVKPKRSLIFVWHTGEEEDLFGSTWFTDHPTVPRDSIVAQLNIDMIGRGEATDLPNGNPGYLQLIGSRRLSTELGDIVEAVNKTYASPFKFDYQYDATGHPEQFYCRSDHYEYARYGIPIVFMSTGGHVDYHQITDEPQYINYPHLAKTASLLADVAERVANLDHRVVVDKPKPDPKGQCVQ
ncbi:MAG TPA: M28 family peptidase [Gemmatimonadaceae bacterium]|nr:M28 family peptidase [Gemmatimonadaceae bacterium]